MVLPLLFAKFIANEDVLSWPCNIKTWGEHLCQWGKAEDNSALFSSTPLPAYSLFSGPSSSCAHPSAAWTLQSSSPLTPLSHSYVITPVTSVTTAIFSWVSH